MNNYICMQCMNNYIYTHSSGTQTEYQWHMIRITNVANERVRSIYSSSYESGRI